MSDLPKGWVQIDLGDAILIQKGKKPTGLGPRGEDRVVPYINISAFETKQVREFARMQDLPRCEPSDTLLVWDGARAGLAGRGIGGFVGSTLARLTSDLVASAYLYYFIHWNYVYLNTHTKGVGIPHVDPIVLSKIPFPLPPSAEQTRIVDRLEELLTDLDTGVTELKIAQKKLGQYRHSLLKTAVEGVLTAEWRDNNHPAENGVQLLERILVERRARWETKQLAKFAQQGKKAPKDWHKKYPEPVQPNTADLPKLPAGWAWASVAQLGDVQLGRQRSPDKLKGISPTRYIRAANITEAGINFTDVLEMDFSEQERSVFELQAGDVLLTEASGSPEHVGRPAIWPSVEGLFCFQNTVIRFKPQGVDSSFMFYSFLAMQKLGVFSQLSGGVGINHLSAGKFSKLPVALPPTSEQLEIVNALVSQIAVVDEQQSAIEYSLKQSAAQRQNILRAAFTGQLVPHDPNDEPASMLLERIRAQRVEQAKQPKVRKIKKKETVTVARTLVDVLTEAKDWLTAQEAFRLCGIVYGAQTEEIEALYAELRALDKDQRLLVEVVMDDQNRKITDRLKLVG